MKNLLFAPILLILVSCSNKKPKNNKQEVKSEISNPLANTKWLVTKVNKIEKTKINSLQAYIQFKEETAQAYIGCNNCNFSYKIEKFNRINTDKFRTTRMYCNEIARTEREFLSSLVKLNTYDNPKDKLTLIGLDNVVIECIPFPKD